ncbi:MAG: S8 family serine peptidase [Candidatus Zixiibacteriota bacterium]
MTLFSRPINSFGITALATIVFCFGSGASVDAAPDLAWLGEPEYTSSSSITVLVFLDDRGLTDQVQKLSSPRMTRDLRIKSVSERLKSFVTHEGQAVVDFVRQKSQGESRRFWIVPAYQVTLSPGDIKTLAAMPDVANIVPDQPVDLIEPVEIKSAQSAAMTSSVHVRLMNIPYLWGRGITGLGRLVCSFDTGVEKDHPALSGNWRGNHAPLSSAWFSTISPDDTPYDKADHGTHTMGTMVGIEGTDTIGVAPGAEWITAGVIDQGKSLSGTFADILSAYQWALDPDGNPATTDDVPDVILNSWGVPASLFSPCDQTFFAAIDNVEAAGIVCVFSAGNEGPAGSSLRNPASRASSPLNAFAVGAVDNSKVIASFSSRGPGGCGLTEVKPEIVAPGVNVRSASKAGGYKLMSGTSMAAPFIAGLVALCRQYNPDATVEEIKWAIINSAEDLGPAGEDNAYGFGLPDASRILNYLTDPVAPHFRLAGYAIGGDGVGLPGETFDLRFTLTRTTGSVESVDAAVIAPSGSGVTMLSNSVTFYFGVSGTTSIGSGSFTLRFDPSLIHGDTAHLGLQITGVFGEIYDNLPFALPIGYPPHGATAVHEAGSLRFTVSDFGQYGFAPGSVYNLGRAGFRYDGSENLLYEAGIIIGRNALQLSSSIRNQSGEFTPSDFAPTTPLTDEWTGPDGALYRSARYVDDYAEVSIPVAITQHTADYASVGEDGIIIIRYRLVNTSLTTLTDLYFGFMSDFDLAGGSETVVYDASLRLLTQSGGSGPLVGLVGVSDSFRYTTMANGQSKLGFTRTQLYGLISAPVNTDYSGAGDLLTILNSGPFRLAPGDSVEVALALVAAASSSELRERAVRARDIYLSPTIVDYPGDGLPGGFMLHQNYPNPFNPNTTIAFDLPLSGQVSLEIFNILGQQVRTLHSGWLAAGTHRAEWDGRAAHGGEVASGVYFYRLVAEQYVQSRKMVLLR